MLIALFLASCSGSDERPEYRERSLAAIYNNAVYNLERGRVNKLLLSLMRLKGNILIPRGQDDQC